MLRTTRASLDDAILGRLHDTRPTQRTECRHVDNAILKGRRRSRPPEEARSLFRAAYRGEVAALHVLIESGADVNLGCSSGDTALHIAADCNHVQVVRRLLECPSINVNVVSTTAGSALHVASHRGHVAIMVLILRHPDTNVNITMPGNSPGTLGCSYTPLCLAVQQGHEAAVAVLLREAATDPNVDIHVGLRPLHIAAFNGYTSIIARLLQRHDIDRGARAQSNLTPLQVAQVAEHPDHGAIEQLFLEADLAKTSIEGDTLSMQCR